MPHSKLSCDSSSSTSSIRDRSASTYTEMKSKFKRLFHRDDPEQSPATQVVRYESASTTSKPILTKRRQMRQISSDRSTAATTMVMTTYRDDSADLLASPTAILTPEHEPNTFNGYIEKLQEFLIILRNMKREDYESATALKILRFLENLIHQPKEWISGAKLKLSEMRFSETAMTLMNSYKEKGYLVRRTVFVHSILLYNAMSNFTDHEFDKEGFIRKQSADAGFIEFACAVLRDSSYRESLQKCYIINSPEEITQSEDFNNYQKILYICDSALTILYNMANLPDLKLHFRDCNAIHIIAEYTKLPTDTVQIQFPATRENEESTQSLKELQYIVSAIRLTSCLLLPLVLNEDEDNNLLATSTSEVLPLLSGIIQTYNQHDQRFYGFSFMELLDGLSKLMVRGRTHECVDKKLIDLLLKILEHPNPDSTLLECVSNAILNASFDEKVQSLLDSDHAVQIIKSTRNNCQSQLLKKNCEAILWTLNRIPHRSSSTISESCQLQGHIMISYNHSVEATCFKIRDRLKSLRYSVWLDVDDINGGVLESMAAAVENSSVVLICMNEQYKQSYYCRLEAEYATELRKPCIPCLMQPRFRPYGWLGIIKGAKIHVDFATLIFDEAFALLIREIETIRRVATTKKNSSTQLTTNEYLHHQSFVGLSTVDNNIPSDVLTSNSLVERRTNDWDIVAVKNWLERCGLSNLEPLLSHMNGKLLWQLYQMKQSAADAYYKFLNHHFTRHEIGDMSDILRFDQELDTLFG